MNDFTIVEYDEIAAKIDEVKEAANFIPDVSTKEGYEASKRVALDIGKILTAIEKARKDKKAYFIEGGKQVDSQAKTLVSRFEAFQLPHKEAYKEFDQLKKQREAERVSALESRVEFMRNLPAMLSDSSSEEIAAAMNDLQQEECLDFFEFTHQALEARNKSKSELADLFVKRNQEEKDAEELRILRIAQEKREREEREEAIRKEASERAEREKQAAIDAAEKQKAEFEEREKQAKADKEAAELRAKQQAEQARLDAIEAEKLAKEQVAKAAEDARLAEIKRQEEEKARIAEEKARREANKKHIGKIRKEAKESLMAICHLSEEDAKKVVLAIHGEQIKNVQINY